jgi:tryptophan synthase alpha chain
MNRIEQRLNALKEKQEKAFITYITAGLPDMEGCKNLIRAQEEAGTDIIELGIPFSDPVADGPVIQAASYKSIQLGTNLRKVFTAVEELRNEGVTIPIVFMMYYNTIHYYGIQEFADRCEAVGVDGVIVPDLPMEEQGPLKAALEGKEAPYLIQLVAPVSADRIEKITKNAKGFIYCVSSMGVTGQDAAFHREVVQYLKRVKEASDIPVMMGFGIRTAKDVEPMKDTIDGVIVGSHFIQLMEQSGYSLETAKEYCSTFKKELNEK